MERNNQLIVYTEYSGLPMQVTFLDMQWWITTPGMKLEPLFNSDWGDVYCLTTGSESVDALGLAKMLGKTVENPVDEIDHDLRLRVKQLQELECFEAWFGQSLNFEWSVQPMEEKGKTRAGWRLRCRETYYDEVMFDSEDFVYEKDAEHWAALYFDVLKEQGISVSELRIEN